MQRQTLKTRYNIVDDRQGTRHVPKDAFPLIIGGTQNSHIRLEEMEIHGEVAHIGLEKGQAFIQAGQSDVTVYYNEQKLRGSVPLLHGDRVQIGSSEIVFSIEDDAYTFQVFESKKNLGKKSPASLHIKEDVLTVEPLSFRRSHRSKRPAVSSLYKRPIFLVPALVFVLLNLSAWYVFTAKRVTVKIEPGPDKIVIDGSFFAPRLGGAYLLRPGTYHLLAFKECYRPLRQPFDVQEKMDQHLTYQMERAPGLLSIHARGLDRPSIDIEGAKITVDGRDIGTTPIIEEEIASGPRQLEIRASHYQDLETEVTIHGCGTLQALRLELVPSWADVFIDSIPQGARVAIDGKSEGTTPLEIKMVEGAHQVEINRAGFKTWQTLLTIKANEPQALENIQLEPADGILALQTKPTSANVTADGKYIGQTPLEIKLSPNVQHDILISKAGYEKSSRKVKVAPDSSHKLVVSLKERKGTIRFSIDPPDAELVIDGKNMGKVPSELALIAVKHKLEIKKKGYESFRTQVTPNPGFQQEIKAVLRKPEIFDSSTLPVIQAKNGYTLRLIRPGPFTMGSSRRDQGRRANETLRNVKLKRPFYMGVREVTNSEFKAFLSSHKSGFFKQHSLSRQDLPVAQITWKQAALFCNWLSSREGLTPAYKEKGDALLIAEPVPLGYRLPTEAEWEYCARFKENNVFWKYPWGNRFPPASKAGNFADESAKDLFASYLKNYNDGFPVAAPPEKFQSGVLGLFDLGGNVSEWCHDYYTIYSYSDDKKPLDPLGPREGKHHVVRGSSWKHASITALRASYRDYSDDKRLDLGFRVCRYAE